MIRPDSKSQLQYSITENNSRKQKYSPFDNKKSLLTFGEAIVWHFQI